MSYVKRHWSYPTASTWTRLTARLMTLELNRSRNVQFLVILWAERCADGQAVPNSLFALKKHPCSISLARIVRCHLYAGVISINLLYPYVESRHYGMCRHILLCCDSDCFLLSRG